jgi:hypothetical protein
MILNFGAVQFIPAGLKLLKAFLGDVTERRFVLWLVPASILPAFLDAPELFDQIARLVAAGPLVSHLAVFPDDFPSLERIMTSFRAVGVGAQRGGRDGACYVEVHKPDGTIVAGIPGPELAPERLS